MSDFSLVPVEYPPNFEEVSHVPVEHDPFSDDVGTQQAQAQPMQPAPQGRQQQPATGANQPVLNGSAPGNVGGGIAASDPNNRTSDQGASSEPAPFGGYANPTPAESLANKVAMDDLSAEIDADTTGKRGSDFAAGKSYRFVTTRPALAPYSLGTPAYHS